MSRDRLDPPGGREARRSHSVPPPPVPGDPLRITVRRVRDDGVGGIAARAGVTPGGRTRAVAAAEARTMPEAVRATGWNRPSPATPECAAPAGQGGRGQRPHARPPGGGHGGCSPRRRRRRDRPPASEAAAQVPGGAGSLQELAPTRPLMAARRPSRRPSRWAMRSRRAASSARRAASSERRLPISERRLGRSPSASRSAGCRSRSASRSAGCRA